MSNAANPSCPICRKLAVRAYLPFCSQGCRDRDLLNWLGEAYAIPAGPAEDDEADSQHPSGQ